MEIERSVVSYFEPVGMVKANRSRPPHFVEDRSCVAAQERSKYGASEGFGEFAFVA
jgi:hypothetical protein